MNVDRLPDGGDDDRERATGTPRLTEPAPPEAPPPPEASQPKKDLPATEKPESTEGVVQADEPPEASDTAAPPPDPAEARETAEPRSRQEHADQPPADEDAGAVDTRVEDPNADTTTEPADDVPDSADVIGEATDDEIEIASAGGALPKNSMSNVANSQGDGIGDEGTQPTAENGENDEILGQGAEELPGQEDPPSDDAKDPGPAGETRPMSDYDVPEGDRILPLTDKEWAEHISEVRDGLSKAYEQNLNTDFAYTINGAGEVWLEERERLHDAIIEDVYGSVADVPCDFKAIVAGGLGGAGKTTVLTQHANIDLSQFLMINPDNIKEEMARRGMIPEIDGLSPMEASELAHEESSHLAKRLAHRAQADGKNLIWDITMSSEGTTAGRIDDLRKAGYTQVDGLFVDISIETSIRRIESRHREGHDEWRTGNGLGGRYVPQEIIESQANSEWGSNNRKTYEAMKERLDSYSTYSNSVDHRPAELIELSRGRHAH
jgi:predicted ABC-type ATPase